MEKYFGIALCSLSSVFSGFAVASQANFSPEQEQQIAQVSDLGHQLAEELEQKKVLVDALDHLEQQVADLVTANQRLSDRQTALVDAQAKNAAISLLNDEASNDARTSYAVGAWYAENAPEQTQRLASIGKTMDLQAFAQGFNDKINNRMQLSPDTLETALADLDRQLQEATRARHRKQSQTLLAAAAKEKNAVTLPGGVIYKILDKGKAPVVTDQSDILFEFDERLSTGEVLATRETRSSQVKRLPAPFRDIFKQLRLGGSATIHLPMSQAKDEPAAASATPPEALSIVTIKVVGIK